MLSQNADGTVSFIHVDPNNPIITLPDGTTAQVQGVATVRILEKRKRETSLIMPSLSLFQLHQGEGGATIQTVQSLTDVNGHENIPVDLTEAQDGQIFITTEDGQGEHDTPTHIKTQLTLFFFSRVSRVREQCYFGSRFHVSVRHGQHAADSEHRWHRLPGPDAGR